MKKIHLLLALTAAAGFTACTEQELPTMNESSTKGDKISVADLNFTVGKGFGDVNTRASYGELDKNGKRYFVWNSAADAIGLSYVGEGTSAVTNYKFNVDSLYNDNLIVPGTKPSVTTWFTTKYQPVGATQLSDISSSDWKASYEKYDKDGTETTLDDDAFVTSSRYAKFKTENDYILKGKYVAYFPAVDKKIFSQAGSIPVVSPPSLSVATADSLKEAAANVYQFSQRTDLTEAGQQVTKFELSALSSIFKVVVTNKTASAINIKTVIIKAKGDSKFAVEGTLNGIPAAANKDAFTVTKSTSALTLTYATEVEIAADKAGYFFMPVLPQTFATGFDIILINEDGKALTLSQNFGSSSYTLPSGQIIPLPVTVAKDATFDDYLATNKATFDDAVTKIKAANADATIKLFNDIEGAADIDLTGYAHALTIEGDYTVETGALTLVADGTLNVKANVEATGLTNAGTVNIDKSLTLSGTVGNTGVINVNESSSLALIGATTTNTGNIEIRGNVTNESLFDDKGAVDTEGEFTNSSKVIVRAAGTFDNQKNATFTNGGVLTCDGAFTNNGDMTEDGEDAKITGTKFTNNGVFYKLVDTPDALIEALKGSTTVSGITYSTVKFNTSTSDQTVTFAESLTTTKNVILAGDQKVIFSIAKDKTITIGGLVADNDFEVATSGTTKATELANLVVKSGFIVASGKTFTAGNNTVTSFDGEIVNEKGTFAITAKGGDTTVKGIVNCTNFSGAGTWTSLPTVVK